MKQDKFQFVLFPVKLNATKYDQNQYTFYKTECNSRILYYSLAVVRVGSNTRPTNIYVFLIFKCIRNWFYFVSLLLLATIFYFILCEIYVKYLIEPIKDIRFNLERLIKERNVYINLIK